jgi:hypothetical protein
VAGKIKKLAVRLYKIRRPVPKNWNWAWTPPTGGFEDLQLFDSHAGRHYAAL